MVQKTQALPFYQSESFSLKSVDVDFSDDQQAIKGYNDCFCLMLGRTGAFQFDIGSSQSLYLHQGVVLVDKPDYEYRMKAQAYEGLHKATVLNFSNAFYEDLKADLPPYATAFFKDPARLSVLSGSTPEIEYLHRKLLSLRHFDRLKVEALVGELLEAVIQQIHPEPPGKNYRYGIGRLKQIERAIAFMHENFQQDCSLADISRQACLSPFHFGRMFKQFSGVSPHQYLLNIRLKHSATLLQRGNSTVAEVALQSGFSDPAYFATAFKQKFGCSPREKRKGK